MDVDQILASEDLRLKVWRQVKSIPMTPKNRETLKCMLYHGDGRQEMAERLGITPDQASVKINRLGKVPLAHLLDQGKVVV